MSWFRNHFRSSIGMKQLMGATGLGLVGFVLVHMLGNLQIFLGQETFNEYPIKLRSLGALLWIARAGLLTLVVLHIATSLKLYMLNRAARPQVYESYRPRKATFYGRYMALLGTVLLAYIVYHLLHFTFGIVLAEHSKLVDPAGRHDLYSYVVLSFQNPLVAIAYIAANLVLVLHLLHGLPSLFQSVGLRHPKYNSMIDKLSLGIVTLIFVGNTAIPLAVLVKVIPGSAA